MIETDSHEIFLFYNGLFDLVKIIEENGLYIYQY